MTPVMYRRADGETDSCRDRLIQWCRGSGLDIGFGGCPITDSAICLDRPSGTAGRSGNAGTPTHLTHDPLDLPFKDGVLDYVYSSHCLEDFVDTAAVIREWLRVLKVGGYLVLFLPDQRTYAQDCAARGIPPNGAHVHSDFSLDFVRSKLPSNCRVVHQLFPVPGNSYSFDLVLQKTGQASHLIYALDTSLTPHRPDFDAALKSIEVYSPTTVVHVIDEAPDRAYVGSVGSSNYRKLADRFSQVYAHMSVNPYAFELACFRRWFIAYEYAEIHGISEFWVMDWDVLLFTDLCSESVTLPMTTPLGSFYCRNLDLLRSWLDQILEAYTLKTAAYESWRRNYESGAWLSVSDMTVAHDLLGHCNELFNQHGEAAWDGNLAVSAHGLQMEEGPVAAKKLTWLNGCPYGTRADGSLMRLKVLHCWGPHKPRMRELLNAGLSTLSSR